MCVQGSYLLVYNVFAGVLNNNTICLSSFYFKKDTIDFWLSFGIEPNTLDLGNVYPISNGWFLENGILKPNYFHYPNDPCYCYDFGNGVYKLYMPFREKGKKFLQTNTTVIQGHNILPDVANNLIITKSYKDVLALRKFAHEFDLYAVAPMAETVVITIDQYSDLYNRFDNRVTLFDFDRAGIRLARKYESLFKLQPLFFGSLYKKLGIKDFADHCKIKGEDETRRLIESLLKSKQKWYDINF